MSMLFVNEDNFQSALEKAHVIYLATSQNDYVTARPMSPINIGNTVYIYTDAYSLKALQLRANPNVAFCFDSYMVEGKARFLGHPQDPGNAELFKIHKEKYKESMAGVNSSVVFIAIDITRIRQWLFENGEPVNVAETRY